MHTADKHEAIHFSAFCKHIPSTRMTGFALHHNMFSFFSYLITLSVSVHIHFLNLYWQIIPSLT